MDCAGVISVLKLQAILAVVGAALITTSAATMATSMPSGGKQPIR